MNLPSFIKVSTPTKAQVLKAVEWALVAFVGSFVASWVKQPNPFSKNALLAAWAAAVVAFVALVRGVTTSL